MTPSSGSGVSIAAREGTGAVSGAEPDEAEPTAPEPIRTGGSTPVWVVALLWVVIAVPFVVAVLTLARPRWFPVLDLAQTELRIRDVASSHPPLIGLPGRIGNLVEQGSHPGPISFWALWPFYELFGATSWAMQAATTTLNLIATGLVLWMARRRGGTVLLLAMATVLAVVLRFYGADILTQAWNPYLPLAWWLVFVVAVWCVLCDDLPMLPVAVFAGSFCVETHISYVGLVFGLAGFTVLALARSAYVHRRDRAYRKRILTWVLVSAGLGVVLWSPAVIQEITGTRGNLDIIWRHFTDPPETPIGFREGVRLLFIHLNPWRLITEQDGMRGSMIPGGIFLVVWAGVAAAAWRLKDAVLDRLNLLLAVALVLALFSMAQIFGYLWFYLVLWSWAINALMLLSVGWAIVRFATRDATTDERARWARTGSVVLGAAIVVSLVLFTVDAGGVESPDASVSHNLGELVRPTVRALDSGKVPGGGKHGRYQVTWVDPVNIGAPGYGLLNELERAGFDVGLPDVYSAIVTPERILDAKDATGTVHLSVGQTDIDTWRTKPGMVEVARYEPRSPRQLAEYRRLRAKAKRALAAAHLPDLVQAVDDNLFMATFQPQVPESIQPTLIKMIALGQPSAIFIGPPQTDTPAVRT